MHALVAGTDLLEYIIARGLTHGRRVFAQFSHLAMPDAASAARSAQVTLAGLTRRSHAIPFRVSDVLENAAYMNSLVRARKLGDSTGLGHRYWHRIRTWEVVAGTPPKQARQPRPPKRTKKS
jgi:hypothetical protein